MLILTTPIKKILLSAMCVLYLLVCLPVSVFADTTNLVTHLEKGEIAPFSGVLMTDSLSAKVIAEKKTQDRLCELQIRTAQEIAESDCKLTTYLLQTQLESANSRNAAILQIRADRITELLKQNDDLRNPSFFVKKETWFVLGILAGSAIFLGSSYALSNVVR